MMLYREYFVTKLVAKKFCLQDKTSWQQRLVTEWSLRNEGTGTGEGVQLGQNLVWAFGRKP